MTSSIGKPALRIEMPLSGRSVTIANGAFIRYFGGI